jgi:hypothetical protein
MNNGMDLFQQAVARLEYVNDQLNRPDEDVVTIALCHQARSIIGDLFGSYLLMNGKDITGSDDLKTLRKNSVDLDRKFAMINLEEMYCFPGKLHHESEYCMDLSRIRACVKIANDLKGLMADTAGKIAV